MFGSGSFPDPLYPNKDDLKFGLQVGKAIENEWFKRHNNRDSRFYDNQLLYHRLRLYARAEQSTARYKKGLAVNGDLSYLNLDWTPIPIAPKFVDIVVNGISERGFAIKAQAIDRVASEHKSKFMANIEVDMQLKDELTEMKEMGIDAFSMDPNQLPDTPEELEIYMQMNFKQGVEIALEEIIDHLLKRNKYDLIKQRFNYDLMVLGKAAMKHHFNPSDGIKVEYVDPANFIYSYSESPYLEDCYYFGEVKRVPIAELKKIDPSLTLEDLEKAKSTALSWDQYHNIKNELRSDFDGHSANLLYFSYKTTREKVYKKKTLASGAVKLTRKPAGWNPDSKDMEERGYSKFVKYEDVWYEGILVLGSDKLLKWELAQNMIRDAADNQPVSPYIAVSPRTYDDRSESILQRMIPFVDQIQLVHLKLQQVAARVVPDGVYIDADGLNEIDLGDGKRYDPQAALSLFFQTGSVIGRSYNAMGEYNHGKIPIQELQHNSGRAKIQALLEMYNSYLQMIRDATGLNEARDASTPDSRTLVGVQKLAALNSNTATRHILDASIHATEKISEAIALRVSDLIKYSDSKDELIDAVGASKVGVVQELDKLPMHRFGIFIEVEPDIEEKEYLEQNIQAAVAQGHIFLDDAEEIRRIKNSKLANRVLRLRREKKMKEEQKNNQEMLRVQSEEQSKTVQTKAQADAMLEQQKAQFKIQVDTNKLDLEDRNQEREKLRKLELMEVEFQYNLEMKGALTDFDLERKTFDAEIGMEQQMRKQRADMELQKQKLASGSPNPSPNPSPNAPAPFESEEDSLDGFDLGQFEPR